MCVGMYPHFTLRCVYMYVRCVYVYGPHFTDAFVYTLRCECVYVWSSLYLHICVCVYMVFTLT